MSEELPLNFWDFKHPSQDVLFVNVSRRLWLKRERKINQKSGYYPVSVYQNSVHVASPGAHNRFVADLASFLSQTQRRGAHISRPHLQFDWFYSFCQLPFPDQLSPQAIISPNLCYWVYGNWHRIDLVRNWDCLLCLIEMSTGLLRCRTLFSTSKFAMMPSVRSTAST